MHILSSGYLSSGNIFIDIYIIIFYDNYIVQVNRFDVQKNNIYLYGGHNTWIRPGVFLLTFITKIYKYVSGHRNGSNEDNPQTTRVDEIGLTIRKGKFLFWPFLFVTSFLVSKLMIVNDNSVVSRVEQKSLGANTTLTLTNKKG